MLGSSLPVARCNSSSAIAISSAKPIPTKPPVATVSPLRIRLTASAGVTSFPSPRLSTADTGEGRLILDDPCHVVDGDDDEHGERLDARDGKDVAVRGLVRQPGYREQRDDGAVIRKRVHAS